MTKNEPDPAEKTVLTAGCLVVLLPATLLLGVTVALWLEVLLRDPVHIQGDRPPLASLPHVGIAGMSIAAIWVLWEHRSHCWPCGRACRYAKFVAGLGLASCLVFCVVQSTRGELGWWLMYGYPMAFGVWLLTRTDIPQAGVLSSGDPAAK